MRKTMRKTLRKTVSLMIAFAMSVSSLPAITKSVTLKAESYGLSNPSHNESGVIWDCVWFGNYYQSNSSTKEPIKWRVLSVNGDDAFLLADKNLDCIKYNETETDVTWETCTLRSWLNGYGSAGNNGGTDYRSDNFIDKAFTSAEQSAIKTTAVVNDDNLYNPYNPSEEVRTDGGNNTNDKIYLLSIREALTPSYGFSSDESDYDEARVAKNTQYVIDKGAWVRVTLAGYWWLRSPGYGSENAAEVRHDGYVKLSGEKVDDSHITVRPALHLNLSSSCWSYAGKVRSYGTADEVPAVITDSRSVLGDSVVSETMNHFKIFNSASDTSYKNIIPGLSKTAAIEAGTGNTSICTNMTPQGICVTGQYILISAYDNAKKENGKKCKDKHNSVIYVLDKSSGSYLTTLKLNNSSHVGGLAAGPHYVYVADSSANKIWKLSINDIGEKVNMHINNVEINFEGGGINVDQTPSFVTYYQGKIFVGYCAEEIINLMKSYMIAYDENGNRVYKDEKIFLPIKTQGVSFVESKNGTRIVASSSLGRKNKGHLYVYDLTTAKKFGVVVTGLLKNMEVPNMCEDLALNGSNLYTCFESAANIYRNNTDGVGISENQLDRIITSSAQKIIKGSSYISASAKVKLSATKSKISDASEDDDIVAADSCGENLNYTLYDDGTLLLTDFGEMDERDEYPWKTYKDRIKRIVVSADVTSIAANAFCECNNLEEVLFSDFMNDETFRIGENAFKGCSKLKKVSMPDGAYAVNVNAFKNVSDDLLLSSDSEDIAEFANKNHIQNHIHQYKYVRTAKPTCNMSGYDLYECECGKTEVRNVSEATGKHDFKLTDTIKTDDICINHYQCKNCDFAYEAEMDDEPATVPGVEPTTIPGVEPTTVPIVEPKTISGVAPTEKPTKIVNNKTTSITKIKSKKKKIKVTWKKVSGINGYKLQYSLKKNFRGAKTIVIKKASTTSSTIKKLKRKKKYYFRIRTYKIVNGKTYHFAWSGMRAKKTK